MSTGKKTKGNEVLIAIIGLICVLVTAGFSNWDKIFPETNAIQTTYSGYRPTDNFETELRYYFNISGARQNIDNIQKQIAQNFTMQLSTKYPKDSEKIKKTMDIALEEAIILDEMLPIMIPVYKNYFTLQELKELNKFYSTEIMQNMIKKLSLLTQELAPLQVEIITNFQKRLIERLYIDEKFCKAAESDAHSIAASIADYFAIPSHITLGTIPIVVNSAGGPPESGGVSGMTFSALTGNNTGRISGDFNKLIIEVSDVSGRCPIEYQKKSDGWNGVTGGGVYTFTMK